MLGALKERRVDGRLMARNKIAMEGRLDPELQEDRQERSAQKRIALQL